MSSSKPRKGKMVVLSGPSGCGKTTVGTRLAKRKGIDRVVTATSRSPRKGEKDGFDYTFLDPADFRRRIRKGEFLEHVQTLRNYYGTPRESVDKIISKGDYALLIIDVKGAKKIKMDGGKGIFIFLVPPSMEELEKRLAGRGTESKAKIKQRMELARRELKEIDMYDYVVENKTVTGAVREILSQLRKEGWNG